MKKVTMIDPPSGYLYGFPKPLPDEVTDLKQWLLEQDYPEKDVEFALKYSRYWTEEIE